MRSHRNPPPEIEWFFCLKRALVLSENGAIVTTSRNHSIFDGTGIERLFFYDAKMSARL